MMALATMGMLFGFWALANALILGLQMIGVDAANANGFAGFASGVWVTIVGRWLMAQEARK